MTLYELVMSYLIVGLALQVAALSYKHNRDVLREALTQQTVFSPVTFLLTLVVATMLVWPFGVFSFVKGRD